MSRGLIVIVAGLLGAGAALAVMVAETRAPSTAPPWMVGTFYTRFPYPSVIRILPSGEAHNLVLDVLQGPFVGRGVATELAEGWGVEFRYADGATLELTFEPRPEGLAVVRSVPEICERSEPDLPGLGPSTTSTSCTGELVPATFRRGALCRAETGHGVALVGSDASADCDWARVATQIANQCCHAARFFDVGTCEGNDLESRLDACRAMHWRRDDRQVYEAEVAQAGEKESIADANPTGTPPDWLVGTFSSETPYPAVVRIWPSGRVVHLILDAHDDDSIGRGVLMRVGDEWVVDLRYESSAQLELRFGQHSGGIAVAEADPLPLEEQPPPQTCSLQDTSRPGHRWQRRPGVGISFFASLRRPVEFGAGGLCRSETTGEGLLALLHTSYEPCAWTQAAKKIADECCDSARHHGHGKCRRTDPTERLEECWRINRNPW